MKLSILNMRELYELLERCHEGSRRWNQVRREISKRWTSEEKPSQPYAWVRSEDPHGGE